MLSLLREGTPWWVSVNLTQADQDIVIPAPAVRGTQISNMGTKLTVNHRLIILGWAYDYVAANGNGFDLEFTDTAVTPSVQRTIITSRATTAITAIQQACPFTFLPGPAGAYNANGSPDQPLGNPASLRLNTTGTPPTSGRLVVWGIHTDADWKPGKLFTGSPVNFGTAT